MLGLTVHLRIGCTEVAGGRLEAHTRGSGNAVRETSQVTAMVYSFPPASTIHAEHYRSHDDVGEESGQQGQDALPRREECSSNGQSA